MSDKTIEKNIYEKARTGDEVAMSELVNSFSPLISSIAGSYFMYGGDNDDLYQIGLIGFSEAVKRYDADKNVDFYKYAKICIHSKIIDAIKEANRKKHSPLNTAVDFDEVNIVSSIDPEQQVIVREQLLSVYSQMDIKLSEYEKQIINLYIEGLSYKEISERIGTSVKSVSNAIGRIRSKLV